MQKIARIYQSTENQDLEKNSLIKLAKGAGLYIAGIYQEKAAL